MEFYQVIFLKAFPPPRWSISPSLTDGCKVWYWFWPHSNHHGGPRPYLPNAIFGKTSKLTYQNLLPKHLQGENLTVKDLLSFSRATLFWRLEAQLLIGVDPTVVRLSWRCSQLGNLDLDTYRQMPKIRNMFIAAHRSNSQHLLTSQSAQASIKV